MKKHHRNIALTGLAVGAAALAMPALSQQKSEPPIARYTMDADTTSGLAAMASGGVNPMAMLRGGGREANHTLLLRLGSSRAATGAPEGEHFMPQGAGLGKSVPLVTPKITPKEDPYTPVQTPRGKLYIYWGCGEHARPGQPLVIDFAKLARGEIPPGLYAQGPNLPDDWRVLVSNSTTYGDWPNEKSTKSLTPSSSLLGDHRVTSTYAPEINFNLQTDFMPALQPRTSDMASGAVNLTWGALTPATGYYAWVIATDPEKGSDAPEIVWWTSSETQAFGGMLSDWLSPAAVKQLIAAKMVMPPTQTSCAIPAEVKQQGRSMLMTQLHAYGPQADFAYPPRPADQRVTWKPEWIARVRFRANAMTIHGMPGMGDFGGQDGGDQAGSSAEPQPAAKPKCPGGLRGMGMRAAGLCQ